MALEAKDVFLNRRDTGAKDKMILQIFLFPRRCSITSLNLAYPEI